MILSFNDKDSEKIWNSEFTKRFPIEIQKKAKMKLELLNAAKKVEELRIPPSNRLHVLLGDRKGQQSISVNDQFRICFTWENGNAYNVEVVDYH
ncbi:MAG: type II toxin-antitoxin system RelE/ParE family toxin [Leptospiraceae bacterium]|nr:type II toxin-antitoxin system RelE/ParE family toxin [Leptospiraceae bacterium]MBK7055088.1 type II toxin-antitoxin system RelE/ParE family toxin [Leptospiraceae bacterium]MBK9498924.1 type II toxin-antitoxin system RelE/ParE family toxin [Leptospiraceae bacterium]